MAQNEKKALTLKTKVKDTSFRGAGEPKSEKREWGRITTTNRDDGNKEGSVRTFVTNDQNTNTENR